MKMFFVFLISFNHKQIDLRFYRKTNREKQCLVLENLIKNETCNSTKNKYYAVADSCLVTTY